MAEPFRPRDVFKLGGTVDRVPYALVGVVLFALKYNLDRLVAILLFGRPWHLSSYFFDPGGFGAIGNRAFSAVLVALALPFVWIGVALTVRRLRSAGLPTAIALLFFVPIVNLLFFVLLSVLPSVDEKEVAPSGSWLERFVPEGRLASAVVAIFLTVPLGAALTWLGSSLYPSYGAGLFVGLPFALGFVAAALYGYHCPRELRESLGVAILGTVILGALLLALSLEGIFCILMAAPIAITLSLMGATVAWAIRRSPGPSRSLSSLTALLLVGVPAQMGLDRLFPPLSSEQAVVSSVTIDAPPEVVWRNVVAFPPLSPPSEWLFRAGIACPLSATIDGTGVGAVRRCNFTTGTFVEPILVWDPPHVLRFAVTEQPETMIEWNPFGEIHPAHLTGFFVSDRGEFRLEPTGDGRTLLTGTTWCRNRMAPAAYWRIWSELIVHRIHLRVLRHVQALSEFDAPPPASL